MLETPKIRHSESFLMGKGMWKWKKRERSSGLIFSHNKQTISKIHPYNLFRLMCRQKPSVIMHIVSTTVCRSIITNACTIWFFEIRSYMVQNPLMKDYHTLSDVQAAWCSTSIMRLCIFFNLPFHEGNFNRIRKIKKGQK